MERFSAAQTEIDKKGVNLIGPGVRIPPLARIDNHAHPRVLARIERQCWGLPGDIREGHSRGRRTWFAQRREHHE